MTMPDKKKLSRPSKRTFSDRLFPARPNQLWHRARTLARSQLSAVQKIGLPIAANAAYVRWLKKESMLNDANVLARAYSGQGSMWQNPFARPRPRTAIGIASVWYTAYPISIITKDQKTSILATLANEQLWQAFESIGIEGLHTGPMKIAGGIKGWELTPTIDGHFDRISTSIDPALGTAEEFRRMSQVAASHGSIIIDDIVPGHTGKGADFRLAEMNYQDYPGIYHMVEIEPADWHILPDVARGKDSVNINQSTEEELKNRGYIIGKLQRVIFYEPGIKETNWSVTAAVRGVDGIKRRWVYLHYFKEGQPSINWLDPSFAGMKLVIGDAVHSIGGLGSRALRLDANGFLGIEKSSDDKPAWSEGHPLSEAANQLISSMVRKLGGFTFQELNLSIDDIKNMASDGADLSYDFITRPAYHHALATGDTEFLRLTMKTSRDIGVDPASLIHALQNHDELTYELVHFWTVHKDDIYEYHGELLKGSALRDIIRRDLKETLVDNGKNYNMLFTENGVACTTATVIASSLGLRDIGPNLSTSQVDKIKQIHLLLVMFNAMQPGVFALSGWDLSGALTVDPSEIADLLDEGDTRWINRGAYDLMGTNPNATSSQLGMPRAISLYGSLPDQLADEESFASQLKQLLALRSKYDIATSRQVDVPDVSHKGMLVMVHQLPKSENMQITVLNFSGDQIDGTLTSDQLPVGAEISDMMTNQQLAVVDDLHNFVVSLQPYQGLSLLVSL